MQFILSLGWEEGIADLTKRLVDELSAGRKVTWLVSGGSNIPASVKVMDSIAADLSGSLTVLLADERYGPVGHPDSNWAQLLQAGFNGKAATLLPVLQTEGSLDEAAKHYKVLAEQALNAQQTVIAQLGIGTDGHLAGILPNSPAATSEELVVAYQSEPYQRLTLGFAALATIQAAYCFAFGEGKHQALQTLHDQTLDLAEQPAQILKQLPEAYVYNDQVGVQH